MVNPPPTHCPHCRAPLEPKARFCVVCGKPVSGPAASPPPPPPPVAPRYPTPPVFKAPRRRRSVWGVVVFSFLTLGVALAGGYFYLNAQPPQVLADLKARLLGSTPKHTGSSSPAPTGSGLTTAQIRTQWAEQALAESRLEDAERELKQAEELEPGSPAIQTLRKRLTETRITRLTEEAEQALAKGQFREADQRLDQAAVLDSDSITVQAARAKVMDAKEARKREERANLERLTPTERCTRATRMEAEHDEQIVLNREESTQMVLTCRNWRWEFGGEGSWRGLRVYAETGVSGEWEHHDYVTGGKDHSFSAPEQGRIMVFKNIGPGKLTITLRKTDDLPALKVSETINLCSRSGDEQMKSGSNINYDRMGVTDNGSARTARKCKG